jgi:anti-anti-sigma factor
MILEYDERGKATIVTFNTDKIDYANSLDMSEMLEAYVETGHVKLVFDLLDINFIASSGILLFLNLKKKLDNFGGKLALCNLRENVKQTLLNTFNVPELINSFKMFRDIDKALKYVNEE